MDEIKSWIGLDVGTALARFAPLTQDPRPALGDLSAGCIRTLDCALNAHARDHGYQSEAWIGRAVVGAAASVRDIEDGDCDLHPLPLTIRRAGGQVGEVVVALHRDRTQVPRLLMGAAGELLLVYAAAINP